MQFVFIKPGTELMVICISPLSDRDSVRVSVWLPLDTQDLGEQTMNDGYRNSYGAKFGEFLMDTYRL